MPKVDPDVMMVHHDAHAHPFMMCHERARMRTCLYSKVWPRHPLVLRHFWPVLGL